MSRARTLALALIRALVLFVVFVVFEAVIASVESTDALGAGLLFFLVLVVASFGWAARDGLRHGLVPAALLWLVTGVLSGLGLSVAFVVRVSDGQGVATDMVDTGRFFGLMVLMPALVGAVLGGIVRIVRRATADA